jgi:hypothetical protein
MEEEHEDEQHDGDLSGRQFQFLDDLLPIPMPIPRTAIQLADRPALPPSHSISVHQQQYYRSQQQQHLPTKHTDCTEHGTLV